ncbi:MAG: hypothetical protein ACYSUK_10340, partial [Planctomycetota bacterium]
MDKILLYPIFIPILVGFIMLFFPSRSRTLLKFLALIISAIVLFLTIEIFSNTSSFSPELQLTIPIVQMDNFNFDLALIAKPLGSFIMIFAA